ncbi:RNA polymerase II-binding domain-containing protein [Kalaharituber pfeilii]|nr:RNA polymerase II-binding domain-containing protein [Kalaharituber pfeilii]
MSYSDETVLSKLSALNETQEGIVSIAQWVMFHRRYAKRTAELWLQRVRESAAQRKLNLIYLANEVVQQSKARKKEDFVQAFTPIIAEATELAYQSPPDIQQKVKRVVQVWRQRQIFDNETLNSIEARVEAVEKGKPMGGTGRRIGGGILGGGLGGGGGVPQELSKLVTAHQNLTGKLSTSTISYGSANMEYTKHMESNNIPAPPVYAARLSQLLKTLDTAHTAVQDAITARSELLKNLELLLDTNKAALAGEQQQLDEIIAKRAKTDEMKREVENKILSGLDSSNGNSGRESADARSKTPEEFDRPAVEALTPPPMDNYEPNVPVPEPAQAAYPQYSGPDLFSTLSALNGGPVKREVIDEMGGMDELDSDVAEMLRKEAQAQAQAGQHQHKRMKLEPMVPADEDDEYHP